jgi:hypothetical protein
VKWLTEKEINNVLMIDGKYAHNGKDGWRLRRIVTRWMGQGVLLDTGMGGYDTNNR